MPLFVVVEHKFNPRPTERVVELDNGVMFTGPPGDDGDDVDDASGTDDTITDETPSTTSQQTKQKRKNVKKRAEKSAKMKTAKKLRALQCMMCGEMFDNSAALARHERLHSRKRYGCSICSKKFRLRIQL